MTEIPKKNKWLRFLEVLAAIATVLALLVAGAQLLADSKTKRLSTSIRVVELASLAPDSPGIELLFKGTAVSRPVKYITTTTLVGPDPIREADFVSPLSLTFPSNTTILSASPIEASPSDPIAKAVVDKHAVHITSLLLNPGDAVRVEILTDGAPVQPVVTGRIAGVSKLEVNTETSTPSKRWPVFLLTLPKWLEWLLFAGLCLAIVLVWIVTFAGLVKATRPNRSKQTAWVIRYFNSVRLLDIASRHVNDKATGELLAKLAPHSQFSDLHDQQAFVATARRSLGAHTPLPTDFDSFACAAFAAMLRALPAAAKESLQSEPSVLNHPEMSALLLKGPEHYDSPSSFLLELCQRAGESAASVGKLRLKTTELVGVIFGAIIVSMFLAVPSLLLIHTWRELIQ